jgi:hypothetical protein
MKSFDGYRVEVDLQARTAHEASCRCSNRRNCIKRGGASRQPALLQPSLFERGVKVNWWYAVLIA